MLPKLKDESGGLQEILRLRLPSRKSNTTDEEKYSASTTSPRSSSDGATTTQRVQENTSSTKKRHSGGRFHHFFHPHSHQHHKEEQRFFIGDIEEEDKRKSLALSDPLNDRKSTSSTGSIFSSSHLKRPKWPIRLHPPSAPHLTNRRRKSISRGLEPPEPPPQLLAYTPVHAAAAIQNFAPKTQRIARRAVSYDGTAAVGLAEGPNLKIENATKDILRSISEQNALLNALPSERILRRRSSCPALERPIQHLKKSTPTKCQRILSIADVQHRSQLSGDNLLKRASPTTRNPGTITPPTSPQEQQQEQRQQLHSPHKHHHQAHSIHERASKLDHLPHPRRRHSTGRLQNLSISRQSFDDSGLTTGSTKTVTSDIPNVVDPVTGRPIIRFSAIQPRSVRLRRRVSKKKEAKALNKWRAAVQSALDEKAASAATAKSHTETIPPGKSHKYGVTRRFILREFYTTEVTFWNQLYYSKVMFHDALTAAVSRRSAYVKKTDADLFANLFDLLQFSAKLLNRLQCIQFEHVDNVLDEPFHLTPFGEYTLQCPKDFCIGKTLCDLAEDMVVFLRCALDYKANLRQIMQSRNNKGYERYKEKLRERKETRQFTIEDYMIIPIQRVVRYNLLLTDLLKHTPPSDPDYDNICVAQKIVAGLASAMNYAQK